MPPFVRGCSIYLSAAEGVALVATVFNHGGLFAERPDAVASTSLGDVEQLGRLIHDALAGCAYEPQFDYRELKRTEWPAFRRSGLSSVRDFERRFEGVIVRGANDSNLVWIVESPVVARFDLRLHASIAAAVKHRELGECVLYVWNAFRVARSRGFDEPAP